MVPVFQMLNVIFYVSYFSRLSFFRLSFKLMVVSPIMMPIGLVSCRGGGVVLVTFVSAFESVEPTLPFPQDVKTPAIATTTIILFILY